MRIKAIHVENFRALERAQLSFAATTALLGENNCGKSAFLNAMDLFFAASPRIRDKDFSNYNFKSPIDITITFDQFTPDDLKEFSDYFVDGNLVVTRRFVVDGGKDNGKYFVSARVNPDFSDCRNEDKAAPKREKYKLLQDKYPLPNVKSADEIEGQLSDWEKANQDQLQLQKTASFKGWTNVASGKLKQKTDFIFIKAVEDAAENIQESKSSPVKNLVNTIARQAIENTEAFKIFIEQANATIAKLTDPSAVPILSDISKQLTTMLAQYYKDSGINATWDPITQIQPNFPSANLEVLDNNFANAIDGVGHGLQRAVILTVLQYMAEHRARKESDQPFSQAESDIILAIEEPEIYQHPIKQRLFAQLLIRLAESFNSATGIRIQVIYVTHSPLMVSLSRCESIRLIRRVSDQSGNHIVTKEIDLTKCSQQIAEFHGMPPEKAWSAQTFAAKLHVFRPEIAEGLFGSKVVMVEGVGDQALIEAWYKHMGRDPHVDGIVIVNVGGKTNLSKVAVIFRELGIPCYCIFDNDKNDNGASDREATNKLLQRMFGRDEAECVDWPVGVFSSFAAWDDKIEKYVSLNVGRSVFDAAVAEVAKNWLVEPKSCLKSPAAASALFAGLCAKGHNFKELEQVVVAIDELS